jgi:hypothetical protein
MKKSKLVALSLLAIASLAMGCDDDQSNEEVKHCVNPDGVVVDESLCNGLGTEDGGVVQSTDDAGNVVYVPRTYVYGPNPIIFYRWYYGGGYTRPLMPGTRIITNGNGYGRFTPIVGHSYSSPSVFSRGGFGSTGHSFSSPGGGGHGGGAGE